MADEMEKNYVCPKCDRDSTHKWGNCDDCLAETGLKPFTVVWSAEMVFKSKVMAKSAEEAERLVMGNCAPYSEARVTECNPTFAEVVD